MSKALFKYKMADNVDISWGHAYQEKILKSKLECT